MSFPTLVPETTADLHESRHLVFDAVVNFRDLGGLPTPDGPVRRGVVYRSGTLHMSGEDDAAGLDRLGIRTVIDLRTDEERVRWPSHGAWRPERVVHAPLLRSTWAARGLTATGVDPAEFLADRYLEMFNDSAGMLARCMDVLADAARHPVVFHCAAGKDRTGVLAAMILSIVGVDDAIIADDYHLSAAAMDGLRAIYATSDAQEQTTMVTQPAAFLAAPREAMILVLNEIRREWGSMAVYAASNGVAAATIDSVRAALAS